MQAGLLLEAPLSETSNERNKVLLTIDITPPVLREALELKASVIVSYHTPIFKPLRSFTLAQPLQATLLRCAHAGISVYVPHSALDGTPGGINDWLVRMLTAGTDVGRTVSCITDKPWPMVRDRSGEELVGDGRIIRFDEPGVTVDDLLSTIKRMLSLRYVQVAVPENKDRAIKSIAICAGSGGSMLGGVDADVYFTGEMQHHDVLAAVARNKFVILCGHTNTERGYLPHLKEALTSELAKEGGPGIADVVISKQDRDPLAIV